MTDKIAFASPEWIDRIERAFRDTVEAAGADAAGVDVSISEQYTDPPDALRPDGGEPLGWHCRIHDGTVDFAAEPSDDCDVVIVADYTGLLPLVRLVYGDSPEAAESAARIGAELWAAGKIKVVGDRSRMPAFLSSVHDAVAKVTE